MEACPEDPFTGCVTVCRDNYGLLEQAYGSIPASVNSLDGYAFNMPCNWEHACFASLCAYVPVSGGAPTCGVASFVDPAP